jgi:hypothetical protein
MIERSLIHRRKFLRWGALSGVLVAAGCSNGEGKPQEVTAPPVGGGNRKLLQRNTEAADAALSKVKKK